MPINTKYGAGAKNPASIDLPSTAYIGTTERILQGTFTFATGDDAGSTYVMGSIPSKAIIAPNALITHAAVAGATSVSIGAVENETALAAALTFAAAGTKLVLASVPVANLSLPLWRLLGLSADPKRNITLYMKVNTNVTQAAPGAAVNFYLPYSVG